MRPSVSAVLALGLGFVALTVNFAAGVDGRCSESGWSGCGSIWYLSGIAVTLAAAVVLASIAVATIDALARRRARSSR